MKDQELFELAEIFSNKYDEVFPDQIQLIPWDDLNLADKGAHAEAIRAVIEELKNRGWVYLPKKVMLGTLVSIPEVQADPEYPDAYYGPYVDISGAVIPRVWDRIEDVPVNTVVEDNDRTGDHYRWSDGVLEYKDSTTPWHKWDGSVEDANEYAPFTEVIEPDTWDRWEDVPVNVWVESVPNGTRYINRNGVRHVQWDDGTDEKHRSSTEWLDRYRAPFKRVG